MKSFALVVFVSLASIVSSLGQTPGPTRLTVMVDGVARHALVFAPSNPLEKSPVIFGFHGHGGSPAASVRGMAFQNAWPEAIVVYPQGIPGVSTKVDPPGVKPGWQMEPRQVNDRDLKFVDALLAKLHEQYSIDDRKIFAAGFSNGAGFTYLLWLERPQQFAGFAAVAGRPTLTGKFTVPKPAVQIGGKVDKLVTLPESKTGMANVRKLNGCPEQGEPCTPSGCMRYSSTKNAPVIQAIHPGGHMYPPAATKLIVNFFKEIAGGG